MMKIFFVGSLIASVLFLGVLEVSAQTTSIDYAGQPAIDRDLDGLTDEAEVQIFGTDMKNADTDNDGLLDGAEVISGADPLDGENPGLSGLDSAIKSLNQEPSWAWYVARAAGLVGFAFLWLTIFLGLSIRNPWLKRLLEPIYSSDLHCFTAAIAAILALAHGTALFFDDFLKFGSKDIFIPFYASTTVVDSNYLALGVLAFYAIVIMTITSYLRTHMSHWLWRVLHFLNPVAFIFTVVHGYKLGTDMQNVYVAATFLSAAALLALIYLSGLAQLILKKESVDGRAVPGA